jgi:hypothetical protein
MRLGAPGERVRLLSLDDLDRRTGAYRKTVELIEAIESDAGGRDQLSTGQRQLVQRAAVTGALLEEIETRWLRGEDIDPAIYAMLGNAQRRLLVEVGLKRVPKELNGHDRELIDLYREELTAP